MRLTSLTAVGRDLPKIARELAASARALKPDALLWLTDSRHEPHDVAAVLSDCSDTVIGGVSTDGLIGGGSEHTRSIGEGTSRIVALALSGMGQAATATPFHSPPDGLPDLPPDAWTKFAAAQTRADSPHLLLLASPPRDGAFAVERWLGRLDSSLPWSTKVGGLVVGDGRLFVGSTQHEGGAVGLALHGVGMDAYARARARLLLRGLTRERQSPVTCHAALHRL